ncbi:MAG: sugar ABC transporter permease [Defluviitaleaceae bacterium]|nr:sugar ABC transporter permease [Defluviitaleaceae bacterium]
MTTKEKFLYNITSMRKSWLSYLFIAPFMIIFFTFTVAPVLMSMGLSFTYFNMFEPPRFIGWQNFINLFFWDEVFLVAIQNTLVLALITGPVGYMLSFLFAWLINEFPKFIKTTLVVVFFAPTISGQMFVIWNVVFASDMRGYANSILLRLGIVAAPIHWLSTEAYIMPITILVVLWMSMGTGFLAFVAGVTNVDKNLYEAGYVDGIRNRWQELWFITLPYMKPQLLFSAILAITGSFAIFEVAVALAGMPSTNYANHTVVTHLVDFGTIRFEMGYASAIAVVLFATMVGANRLVQRLLRKVGT